MTRRILVLDDDPTGSQSASNVAAVLVPDPDRIEEALAHHRAVFVITNTRALDERSATELLTRLRDGATHAARRHGWDLSFVLRGDSTLRGHVFAETAVFESPLSVVVFAPAFPAGGRVTRDGVHHVTVAGRELNAADSEFARDPVFGYHARTMKDYVTELAPGRDCITVTPTELFAAVRRASAGDVVVPDIVTDDDVDLVASQVDKAWAAGLDVVVRGGAPLAATLAGVRSTMFVEGPIDHEPGTVLVVCGSHTEASSLQLSRLTSWRRIPTVLVSSDQAMADPPREGARAARAMHELLDRNDIVLLSSERHRRPEHGELHHGERVMAALTHAVSSIKDRVAAVVAKGGITSAEVARDGLGADSAHVVGQLLPGVSLWRIGDRRLPYVVVPGNVGGPDTLVSVVSAMGTTDDPRSHEAER